LRRFCGRPCRGAINPFSKYRECSHHATKTRREAQQESNSNKKKWLIAALALLLLLSATAAWAMWSREDPQLAKVREMAAAIDQLPPDQRRAKFREVGDEVDKLTEEQRDQFRSEMRQRWEAREEQELKDFFALSPEQQIAELDKRIDRMQEWRQRREKEGNRGRRGGRGGGGGQRSQSFGKDGSGNVRSVQRDLDQLDRRSAGSRARRDTYRQMMVERMKQRGIPFPTRRRG
jgi:hypothetical protein